MLRSLWTSKSGMEAQQTQLDAIAHNLANTSTNGYKSSHVVFEDLIYQNLRQSGANSSESTQLPTGLQIGLGVQAVGTTRNYTQGNLEQTSNTLDVAISGEGFFEVQMPDGSTSYTRDGSFQRSSTGQIVTAEGYTVQPGITIPEGAKSVTIAEDGTVSAILSGQSTASTIGQFQLATFVNPAGLEAKGQNLFTETASSGSPNTAAPGSSSTGTLKQGYVETSNVNVVEEMVGMIQTQRAYEINSKAIQAADDMLQRLGQIG